MTAIVGFNCNDGVVIAGETEESYGDNKAYTHKLFPARREHSRLCVAGAGLGYLIDHANAQIVSAFDSGRVNNANEFEVCLADILNDLYENKFPHFPVDSQTDLRMDLLVAVQFARTPEPDKSAWGPPVLFECRSNLVTRIGKNRQSCILGTGEVLKEIGLQLSGWGMNTELAEWGSAYVIHQAKRRFGGVGGKTHIFTLRTDGTHSYDLGKFWYDKEAIFDFLIRTNQLLMFSLCPSVEDSRAKDFIDAAKTWLLHARRHLQSIRRKGDGKHASIEIRSREIEKMLRHINSAKPLASRKSEPER